MNKEQKKKVEDIIAYMKRNKGMITTDKISHQFIKNNDERIAIMELLENDHGYVSKKDSLSYVLKNEGWNFKSFSELENKDVKMMEKEQLEFEIIRLQRENLILNNRKLKRYVIYSIIGFILGAISTNLKEILTLLKIINQE